MNATEHILTKVLQCRRGDLYDRQRSMSLHEHIEVTKMMERFEDGEPLQYIIGDVDFYNVTLNVNRDVLIPRPETEILVDTIVQTYRDQEHVALLDMGTGSGCIAIALAKALPQARLFAVDISIEAIAVAQANAKANGVEDQIAFVHQDMQSFFKQFAGQIPVCDGMISNPPYIPTKELACLPVDVRQEPVIALDGGEDGLMYYHCLVHNAAQWLKSDGYCFFEIGDHQAEALQHMFDQSPLSWDVQMINDYTQTPRIVRARWKRDHG